MSVTVKKRASVSETTKNIKTYKLIEIPLNDSGVSVCPVCPIQPHQVFKVGDRYKIMSRVLEKIYECRAYIDVIEENPNECLDIVIMKPISGQISRGWTLSETDCEFLHIDYEKNLLVFPATYDFKKV